MDNIDSRLRISLADSFEPSARLDVIGPTPECNYVTLKHCLTSGAPISMVMVDKVSLRQLVTVLQQLEWELP